MSLTKNLAPYLSIVFAGVIGFQSLAIGQTTPAPRQVGAKAVTAEDVKYALSEGREFVESMKAISATRGLSLADAKEMMLKVQKTNTFKKVTSIAGVDSTELSQAVANQMEKLSNLHSMMTTSKAALDVLIKNPIKDPVVRALYTLVLGTNQVSQIMAYNDTKGTPIFFKDNPRAREIMRAWVIALPLVGAALIRWYDPTATINIAKIHDEMDLELNKLAEGDVNPDFKKEIGKILEITKGQLEKAKEQANMFTSAMQGITDNANGSFVFNGQNINVANVVAFASLIYAIMESLGGRWAAMAEKGKNAAGILSEQYKAVSGAIQKSKEGSKLLMAKSKQIAASTAQLGNKIGGHRVSASGGTLVGNGTDAIGNIVAATSGDAVTVARVVAVDYFNVIAEIESTMVKLRAVGAK